MIEDLLQEIVALEKEQDLKVKNSVQEGKDIVAKAKVDANNMLANAEDTIKDMRAKNIAKAGKDADKKADAIIKSAEDEAKKCVDLAQKNNDKIVADIIRRLEARYA